MMPFIVSDFHDLVMLLEEHPEWRPDLRRLVLNDEFLALPRAVEELTKAQQRTEQRLEELIMALGRTDARVARLEEGQKRLEDRVGKLDARVLEFEYERKAGSYFGRLIRKARVVTFQDVEDQLWDELTTEERGEVLALDLMVAGKLPGDAEPQAVLLAVEISVTVDAHDVERTSRRAEVLRRVRPLVIPVVAGDQGTQGAEDLAQRRGVAVLYDDRVHLWPEAVAQWTGSAA